MFNDSDDELIRDLIRFEAIQKQNQYGLLGVDPYASFNSGGRNILSYNEIQTKEKPRYRVHSLRIITQTSVL